ncbi:MAG TPA: erythromycin esterase family protein, partial [Pyrinomonadaceae bacterium]|nr:erythromycin esterase family protein [Pyrinomonadaceae bacterium]
NLISKNAVSLTGPADVPREILELVGDARFVLIGEASHGTHEFYKFRAAITKRLIDEKNFSAVAVEADFPDAYRVNRYVRGSGGDESADDALRGFQRYPLWMWRNADVVDFVDWLRENNEDREASRRVGFYGIDLYSLHSSVAAVLEYLDKTDPQAAGRARYRYSCFEGFGEDPQHYGYAASFDLKKSCEDGAIRQLIDIKQRAADYMNRDGFVARDEYFFAEQNARLVKNAEEYYREMFRGRVSSWNLRDAHMAETVAALGAHLETQQMPPKVVVWAHNSHIGDARATDMAEQGEWNVGQLVRERFRDSTVNIGFTTYSGTVTATSDWDEPAQLKRVRPALDGSIEDILHRTTLPRFFLDLRKDDVAAALARPRLERAIGVIYRPDTERQSHYFRATLPSQFDGIVHFDESSAVEPLDRVASWVHDDAPETFPSGV